jgi:hypothetical protein
VTSQGPKTFVATGESAVTIDGRSRSTPCPPYRSSDLPGCATATQRSLVTGPPRAATQVRFAPTKDALFWIRLDENRIETCVVAGCNAPSTLLTTTELAAIATDDQYIYFSTGNGKTLERCPHAGCGAPNRVILAAGAYPHALDPAWRCVLSWKATSHASSTLQRRPLRITDSGFDLALAIGVAHTTRQRERALVAMPIV